MMMLEGTNSTPSASAAAEDINQLADAFIDKVLAKYTESLHSGPSRGGGFLIRSNYHEVN
jgi:hypothetical protein